MPSALRLLPLAFPGQLSASAGLTLASTSAVDMKPGKQRVSEATLMHTDAPAASLQLHPLHPGLCSFCTSRNTQWPGHRLLIPHWLLSSCSFPVLSTHPLTVNSHFFFPWETSVRAFTIDPCSSLTATTWLPQGENNQGFCSLLCSNSEHLVQMVFFFFFSRTLLLPDYHLITLQPLRLFLLDSISYSWLTYPFWGFQLLVLCEPSHGN